MQYYKQLLDVITSRVNTITRTPYLTDPTILAWNLMNGARRAGKVNCKIC